MESILEMTVRRFQSSTLLQLAGLFAVFLLSLSCSARPESLAEPVIEQTTLRSSPVCIFSWFCSPGRSGALNFKGVLNNRTGEKPLFLEYYVSSFEESFPIGVSLKLDQTWHNLRKVTTDYGETLRLVSILPPEVADKIMAAKEIEFSFSSREHTVTKSLGSGDSENLKQQLKELKTRLDAQAKLSIANY
ncbi:hypothetical protein [Leptospira fletcheri]|nr:hypothetical protein [Leptospira fletcheri]